MATQRQIRSTIQHLRQEAECAAIHAATLTREAEKPENAPQREELLAAADQQRKIASEARSTVEGLMHHLDGTGTP